MARDTHPAAARPTFPVYLLPSFKIPFRRRHVDRSESVGAASYPSSVPSLSSSPNSSASTSPGGSPPSPAYFNPPSLTRHLPATPSKRLSRVHPDTLRCSICSADLAFSSQIVSKGFTGRYGRAYLVSPPAHIPTIAADLANIRVGRPENRQLVTGAHVVADITCVICGNKLGWKYVDAKEPSQKYKVGKFILETQRVVGHRRWEDINVPEVAGLAVRGFGEDRASGSGDEIVFDSDDEDECEDIFAGTWDAETVAKRRGRKFGSRRRHTSD